VRIITRLKWSKTLLAILCLALFSSPYRETFGDEEKANKPNFEKWEASIQKFESQDKQTPQPQGANLFVGSSSIRMWKLDKSFPKSKTINRGFGGSEIADSIHFADRIILKHQPAVILLYAGDNDISHGKSAETVTADFRKFVSVVRKKLPDVRITFIAIKPSIKRWNLADEIREANKAISAICAADNQMDYVDVFKPMLGDDGKPRPELFLKDGLHMNDEGYRLWASIVRPLLK
jgi:lysophospholipase L1-like esterase